MTTPKKASKKPAKTSARKKRASKKPAAVVPTETETRELTDYDVCCAIAERFAEGYSIQAWMQARMIDVAGVADRLNYCHDHVQPLRLEDLRTAPLHDVLHDVAGIVERLDVRRRKLSDCFLPRYAERERTPS